MGQCGRKPLPVWRAGGVCRGIAAWPDSDFIIGNPPFLGSKLLRQQGLEDDYITAMYEHYDIPNSSDLCCYWFECARKMIEFSSGQGMPPSQEARAWPRESWPEGFWPRGFFPGTATPPRCGLLATQAIRGGANRRVLERIKDTGDLFMAWSDRDWVLDGAHVHVSIVGFDNGAEADRKLDGSPVSQINANLSTATDLGQARPLQDNQQLTFMGTTKGGSFDVDWHAARTLLAQPNPTGRANTEVVRPWINGSDVTKRPRAMWIVDFGCEMPETEAAGFEAAFRHAEERVKPVRVHNRREAYAKRWWGRPDVPAFA